MNLLIAGTLASQSLNRRPLVRHHASNGRLLSPLALWLITALLSLAPWMGNAASEGRKGGTKPPKARYTKELTLLTQWLTGDFDNTKQTRVDTTAAPVESHMVKIWENYFSDAVWMYEEFQSPPGQVVSQRIYRFKDYTTGRYEAKVYTLDQFADYTGEYKNLRPFESMTPEDLTDHPYCVVYFVRKGETRFSGSTVGNECYLNRGKHHYVTNQLDVYPTRVSRTERIFGWENELVSGPAPDAKGSELRRIVPPKPKKIKKPPVKKAPAKKPASKKSGKDTKKTSKSKSKEQPLEDPKSEAGN
ncbi:MAG: hypothetical protein EBR29_05490 [Sphingobacteriia bacterium]|jgi:hypothetical protein|nr:hypothetical protein [Sphingobacteriia bacterium]